MDQLQNKKREAKKKEKKFRKKKYKKKKLQKRGEKEREKEINLISFLTSTGTETKRFPINCTSYRTFDICSTSKCPSKKIIINNLFLI